MRNTIIAANGTSFREEGSTRRLLRRATIAAVIFLAALFASAAVIGFTRAASADSPHTPTTASLTALHKAQAAHPKSTCILEWNEAQADHEAICTAPTATYNDGWVDATQALIDLYARAPRSTTQPDGSIVTDPRGSDLVTECLDDATLKVDEVMACLAQ